ncbi:MULTISPECIES: hypothetical protein [unclassified Massilia]|uniref:hypothetical protein n=1 Tax=unclassified Massilia TaxID=2609279 RepID=UPI0017802898|nr:MULTISPECIES: hypothetical protein [unclassified Massilia]MBD8531584.1 hypothetical protein [Massilia sp. CFBP 13647]MBD8673620.1 hypothetical protein [Massilia sp. CFBP 13721]
MIEFFAEFDPDTRIVSQCLAVERPYQGNFMEAGRSYIGLPGPIDWSEQSTPTEVLHLIDEVPKWIETAPLAQIRAQAITAIDAAAESLRLAVVNRMTMQSEEYRRVEAQARAWREAGYPEEEGGAGAPRGVAGWAMAKWRDGWTNRQAADDILATADGWMHILDEVRDLRLMNKEDVRHAAEGAEIAAITADMRIDMRAMAAQLNLTLTE